MGSRRKEVVKREKRLPKETGGSFAAETQAWVQSTCSRAGLCSEESGLLGETANNNLMKFGKKKCKVLPLSREKQWHQHRLGMDWFCCGAALL